MSFDKLLQYFACLLAARNGFCVSTHFFSAELYLHAIFDQVFVSLHCVSLALAKLLRYIHVDCFLSVIVRCFMGYLCITPEVVFSKLVSVDFFTSFFLCK